MASSLYVNDELEMSAPNATMNTTATDRKHSKVDLLTISGLEPTFYVSNLIVLIATNILDNSRSDSKIHKVDNNSTETMNNINRSKDTSGSNLTSLNKNEVDNNMVPSKCTILTIRHNVKYKKAHQSRYTFTNEKKKQEIIHAKCTNESIRQ